MELVYAAEVSTRLAGNSDVMANEEAVPYYIDSKSRAIPISRLGCGVSKWGKIFPSL